MSTPLEAVKVALSETETALKMVAKIKTQQVTRADQRDYLKSIAFSWFQSHRPPIADTVSADLVRAVDLNFQRVLEATDRASSKSTYLTSLKRARVAIAALRAEALRSPTATPNAADATPDFSPLASDVQMQEILGRRWNECLRCLNAGAHLAATVMMGGLLEALFVARANQLANKEPLFTAKATPFDKMTNKPLRLKDWTLRPYIEVGRELGWISKSAQDVAEVLRDYRNYVHPEKERSHGVTLSAHDTEMFWLVTKSLAKQLLKAHR